MILEPTRPHLAAEEIRDLRKRLAMTQRTFAAALGVSVHTVQQWEQDRQWPSIENERKIKILSEPSNLRKAALANAIIAARKVALANLNAAKAEGDEKAYGYDEIAQKLRRLAYFLCEPAPDLQ
jgi:DNA-binding XRE family transcriptional regulator